MRILFVTNGLPYPPHSGVRVRDFNLIKNVSKNHSVLLLSLLEFPEEVEHLQELKKRCDLVDFVIAKRRSIMENFTAIMRGSFSSRPLATHSYYYEELASKICEVAAHWQIDIIQIEHSFLAPYITALPSESNYKKILSFHNVGVKQSREMLRMKLAFKDKFLFFLKWMLMLRWEAKYAEKFDRCLVVSQKEQQLLKSENANLKISIIENGVDTKFLQPLKEAPDGSNLLFVGTMGYDPNVDAVLYFYNEMMPLIRSEILNAKLIIVGHHPSVEIKKLASQKDVTVTGYVPDVIPYYQQSQIIVVPLRAGGGTRLKILEAMALGRPVVSTQLGCEGLNISDGENIMIADTPPLFAEKVIELLSDRKLRQEISVNARKLVETDYDWQAISRKLMKVYRNLLEQKLGSTIQV